MRANRQFLLIVGVITVGIIAGSAVALVDNRRENAAKRLAAQSSNSIDSISTLHVGTNSSAEQLLPEAATSKDTRQTATSPSTTSGQAALNGSSLSSNAHKRTSCDQTAHGNANNLHSQSLANENKHHHNQLLLIETTGVVTRLLNPGMYAREIAQENSRYNSTIASINAHYLSGLMAADC